MDNVIDKDNLNKHYINFDNLWNEYVKINLNKNKNNKVTSKKEFIKIIKECLKTISFLWTNSTGGIYVKNFGYFTLLRPIKKLQKDRSKEYINNIYRTSGYSYFLTHITNLKKSDSFHGFKVRRAASLVRKDARKNILAGRRYTINTLILKEYLKNKKNYDI